MTPEEQISAIKDVMCDESFDNFDKVGRVTDILNPTITIADLAAAQEEAYRIGYHEGRNSLFTCVLVWGIICVASGVVIGMAAI